MAWKLILKTKEEEEAVVKEKELKEEREKPGQQNGKEMLYEKGEEYEGGI